MDNDDVEDGELVSSGEEELAKAVASSSPTAKKPSLYMRAPAPIPTMSESEESSEDSDSDTPVLAKKCRNMKDSRPPFSRSEKNVHFENPLLKQKFNSNVKFGNFNTDKGNKRRVNNVWGSVVTEQTIVSELGGVGVNDKKDNIIERDVESYSYNESDIKLQQNIEADVLEVNDIDDPFDGVDIEKVEDVQPSKSDIGKVECQERSEINDFDTEIRKAKRHQRFRDNLIDDEQHCISVKERLGNRERQDLKRKASIKDRVGQKTDIVTMCNLPEEDAAIVNNIILTLNEDNVEMIANVVSTLGRERASKFLSMTLDVESSGGMLIKDGSRRRTPGGVYLQLIKGDKTISKELRNKLFQSTIREKEAHRAYRKAKRRQMGRAIRQEMEDLKKDILEAKRKKDLDSRSQEITGDQMDCDKTVVKTENSLDMKQEDNLENNPQHELKVKTDNLPSIEMKSKHENDQRAENKLIAYEEDGFLDDANICDIELDMY